MRPEQLVDAPHDAGQALFLHGLAGSGKTTLAVQRLGRLLERGVPAEQILVLVPQRTLGFPYQRALHGADTFEGAGALPGGQVDIATLGGLARRSLDLFWPLVAPQGVLSRDAAHTGLLTRSTAAERGPAGLAHLQDRRVPPPSRRPNFLTLETAQYYMDAVVEPMVAAGAFDGITISRARLVSQIIDNLNKAAAVGFAPAEIAARLRAAWTGESARERIYEQVQEAALAFRSVCLEANLLDWSLQIELFSRHLLPLPQVRRYLLGGYRHLIVDNVEEDIPATHDLLRTWLPRCESALVVCDEGGGYRVFLGADPAGALALAELCQAKVELSASHVMAPEVEALGSELAARIPAHPEIGSRAGPSRARQALTIPEHLIRFHPQMLDWVADQTSRLVMEEGLPPGEIAILAPFLSDALRFSLSERLAGYGIPVRSHRPSRELGEEPAARCLLTLARLAHPHWHDPAPGHGPVSGTSPPPRTDVAQALGQAIADLDPVRAQLLAEVAYRVEDGLPFLAPFHQMIPEMQERLTYLLGNRYDELRRWLEASSATSPAAADTGGELDFFLSRLFGEVLSQPGFGFHADFDRGAVAASLIESVQKFRQGYVQPDGSGPVLDLGLTYVDMVERGVVAAQSIASWTIRPEDAVLLVPAYTFLMMNQPVTVQFWLDAGSRAWFERIYQPLTHPFVLRRDWDPEGVWTDDDEVRVREEVLRRLVRGLCRRCRRHVYLAYSELNERGYEQQGPLLQALYHLRRRSDRDR